MKKNKHKNWNVFVANIPFVTIAPLAKGLGEVTKNLDPDNPNLNEKAYYKYYTYFPFEVEDIYEGVPKLTLQNALQIDEFIARYNISIGKILSAANNKTKDKRFHLVDTATALTKLAWKRNFGNPTYDLPEYLHDLIPQPNTKYYHGSKSGTLEAGGIFSLDGVHPSAIGQGLIAYEFLKVMESAKVKKEGGKTIVPEELDWPAIVDSDNLYKKPIRVMGEVRENKDLAQWVLKTIGLP